MPRTGLAATSLVTSIRRWRLTSAAVVDSPSDQRSGVFTCWRGNAAGLGGWTFVTRISLATLQAAGMAFFGLYGSNGALAPTLTLSAVVSCIGIGFQRGTHTRWQLVANDASGAPTLVDMGASFGSVARRYCGNPNPIVTNGPLEIDLAAHSVHRDGKLVLLTVREWALFEAFLARPGQLLSKTQLEEKLYAFDAEVESNTI